MLKKHQLLIYDGKTDEVLKAGVVKGCRNIFCGRDGWWAFTLSPEKCGQGDIGKQEITEVPWPHKKLDAEIVAENAYHCGGCHFIPKAQHPKI